MVGIIVLQATLARWKDDGTIGMALPGTTRLAILKGTCGRV